MTHLLITNVTFLCNRNRKSSRQILYDKILCVLQAKRASVTFLHYLSQKPEILPSITRRVPKTWNNGHVLITTATLSFPQSPKSCKSFNPINPGSDNILQSSNPTNPNSDNIFTILQILIQTKRIKKYHYL